MTKKVIFGLLVVTYALSPLGYGQEPLATVEQVAQVDINDQCNDADQALQNTRNRLNADFRYRLDPEQQPWYQSRDQIWHKAQELKQVQARIQELQQISARTQIAESTSPATPPKEQRLVSQREAWAIGVQAGSDFAKNATVRVISIIAVKQAAELSFQKTGLDAENKQDFVMGFSLGVQNQGIQIVK
jgi:hypothetical protein